MATGISKYEDSPLKLVEAAKEDQTGGLLVVMLTVIYSKGGRAARWQREQLPRRGRT